MSIEDLDDIPENDDLSIIVEQFKNELINFATGETENNISEANYSRLRKILLETPNLQTLIPRFIRVQRNKTEFLKFIRGEFKHYSERRSYLNDIFNPIVEHIENEEDKIGLEFSTNYTEQGIIGSGGFGQVYKYEHRLLNLIFAIKVFAPVFNQSGNKELERFFQEARMLFLLNHPNVIRIYDVGFIRKRPFIRMEYFEGQNLNEFLNQNGVLYPAIALIIIKDLVEALEYAHNIGIVHRDLKPSNVMIDSSNKIKVIDFGLGVFIENDLHSRLTKTGEHAVSGLYNAPELNKNPKLIDKRSDIYSIGAIWFTMLMNNAPAGTSFSKQLRRLENISERYISCIEKCLEDVEDRYTNCEELLKDLKELILNTTYET